MSYWTKRRKVNKNVKRHIDEIQKALTLETESESQSLSCIEGEENECFDNEREVNDVENLINVVHDDIGVGSETLLDKPEAACSTSTSYSSDLEGDCNIAYYTISSDSESYSDSDHENEGLNEQLAQWAVDCNIPNDSVGKLLSILKPHLKDLPSDPRTLLRTKLHYEIKDICGGQYFHFGLGNGIQDILMWQTNRLDIDDSVKVQMSIDGLPLFKSSSGQFWPILGRVENMGNGEPFIIGLFYGNSKPSDVSVYLGSLVEELNDLTTNGLICMELHYKIVITSIICDSPARSFIKNVKQYSGYHGCDKCIQTGLWQRKMTYPELNSPLRSDADFLNRVHEDHHKGPSPLEGIVGMVSQFPLDYMHLVCLGVVKRLILSWLKGDFKVRIGSSVSNQISTMLYSFRHYIPSEFARKPRGFSEIDRWKATEFRQFLLYTGPVALGQFMNEVIYKNFMLLSISLHILLNSYLVNHYNDYAQKLLTTFVQHYMDLYGKENIVFNVHGLLHLPLDAEKYGTLDNISSFPFENFLMKIKKMVRKPTFPLQQIIRRLSEKKPKPCHNSNPHVLKQEHTSGPLLGIFDISNCKQYQSIKLGKFELNLRSRDRAESGSDYLVVEFKDEEEVAVIPKIWLKGSDKCLWPSYKSVARIEKAVRNKEIPDDSFQFFEVARIMYRTDSYSKAFMKVKQAEILSDLQTEEEDSVEGKRKRRPTVRYESDSSPEKPKRRPVLLADSSPEKTPQKKRKRLAQPLPDLPPIPTPPRKKTSTPNRMVNVHQNSSFQERVASPVTCNLNTPLQVRTDRTEGNPTQLTPRSTGVTVAERKMIELLEEIRHNTIENKKSLAIVMKKLDVKNDGPAITPLPNGVTLPLATKDHFQRVERLLENEDLMKKMINHLGTIGGDSVGECCRRTLKYVMTNELATNFNWKGLGDKKMPFSTSRLLLVIKGAIRKNRLTVHATDKDIDKIAKDWFRYAKDRDGGRKQRADKKRVNVPETVNDNDTQNEQRQAGSNDV